MYSILNLNSVYTLSKPDSGVKAVFWTQLCQENSQHWERSSGEQSSSVRVSSRKLFSAFACYPFVCTSLVLLCEAKVHC